jgi:HEPN domain-containing protein
MKEPNKDAQRWFRQSEDDYRFVKYLKKEEDFFDKGSFMAQQAGEKALKSCLYATGKRRVIGHSLYEMADELSKQDNRFRNIVSASKRLDRYYIPTRYPNGIPGGSPFQVFDKEDLNKAFEDLKMIIDICRQFLEDRGALLSKNNSQNTANDKDIEK